MNDKKTEWTPVLGGDDLDSEKYREIYSKDFFDNIFKDFGLDKDDEKELLEDAILCAAMSYELSKKNYHSFYLNKTERKRNIEQLKTALDNTHDSYSRIIKDNKYSLADLMFAIQRTYKTGAFDGLDLSLISSGLRSNKECRNLRDFFDFLIESCDNALTHIDKTNHRTNATDPLYNWLSNMWRAWPHERVTYTEGNPDYADCSKAVKIIKKILEPLDPSVTEATISHMIKKTKSEARALE